jgi:hypothetical protein
MMEKTLYDLRNFLDSGDPSKVAGEISILASEMGVPDASVLDNIYKDIVRLFSGDFPGYRASNTMYHNLEHTGAVSLAAARIIHGLWLEGHSFAPDDVVLCITAALFHDTGLIQTEDDSEGTGAKYTIGHEQRSISLARSYMHARGFAPEAVDDCGNLILYTILSRPVAEIPFRRDAVSKIGKIIGSADLMAQMADRLYLEKLPLLFMEFREGGLPNYATEIDLLFATDNFYENIFKKRIYGDLEGIAGAVKSHFRERWDLDRDLYMESVEKNVAYLHSLKEHCSDSYKCYLKQLRRGNIIKNIYGENYQ